MQLEGDIEWWTRDWTVEQKRVAGDPKAKIAHRHRLTKKIDADERRYHKQLAKEYFNPNVN